MWVGQIACARGDRVFLRAKSIMGGPQETHEGNVVREVFAFEQQHSQISTVGRGEKERSHWSLRAQIGVLPVVSLTNPFLYDS